MSESAPTPTIVRNTYFKDSSGGLISGRPLPINHEVPNPDGTTYLCVYNVTFDGCTFHPNCACVIYERCTFIDCDGMDNLDDVRVDCIVK